MLFVVAPYPAGYTGYGFVVGIVGIAGTPPIGVIVFKKGFAVGRTPGTDYTSNTYIEHTIEAILSAI